MRILVVPSLARVNAENDDAYMEFIRLVKAVIDSDKKSYWYFVIPSWVREGIFYNNRITYLTFDSSRDPLVNIVAGFPAYELASHFSRRGGKYIIDAVITDCSVFSGYISKLVDGTGRKEYNLPVFLRDNKKSKIKDDVLLCSNIFYSTLAVRSDSDASVIERDLSSVFNPSVVRNFKQKYVKWDSGFDVNWIDNTCSFAVKKERITFLMGRNHLKNDAKALKMLDYFGVCNILFATTRSKSSMLLLFDDSFVFSNDFKYSLSINDYLLEIASCHGFISTVDDKIDSFSYIYDDILKILCGQVGIIPRNKNTLMVFGNDYPFYYIDGDLDDALEVSRRVISDYSNSVSLMSNTVLGIISEMNSIKKNIEFWDIVLNKIKESNESSVRESLHDAINDIAHSLGRRFSLDIFLDILEEKETWLKPWGRKGNLKDFVNFDYKHPTMYDIRSCLEDLGWNDTCDSPDVIVENKFFED